MATVATNPRQRLFTGSIRKIKINPDLHLQISIRSIKSPPAAHWVDAVLRGEVRQAWEIAGEAGGVPFLLTRSLQAMRGYLRSAARGLRRSGLVCSAGARRLRADGGLSKLSPMERGHGRQTGFWRTGPTFAPATPWRCPRPSLPAKGSNSTMSGCAGEMT